MSEGDEVVHSSIAHCSLCRAGFIVVLLLRRRQEHRVRLLPASAGARSELPLVLRVLRHGQEAAANRVVGEPSGVEARREQPVCAPTATSLVKPAGDRLHHSLCVDGTVA